MKKSAFAIFIATLLTASQLFAQEMHVESTEALVIQAESIEQPVSWKKAYFQKLRRVSPRISYGIGTFEAHMRYQVPDLQGALKGAANDLDNKYAWIPWKQLEVQPAETHRLKTLRKSGSFFLTGGINLPIFYLDIEAGVGRFSEPLLTVGDIFPLNESVSSEGFGNLLIKRVTTPSKRGSINFRLGLESERLLPDHLQPRLKFGPVATGIDVGAYYLLAADFSYRIGFEALGEETHEKILTVFKPIPFVPEKTKREAAEALLGHMESRVPAYLWAPALHGYGLKAKVYLDIGKDLRISGTYIYEKGFGMKLKSAEWLNQGPQVWRSFYTIGIESKR